MAYLTGEIKAAGVAGVTETEAERMRRLYGDGLRAAIAVRWRVFGRAWNRLRWRHRILLRLPRL